MTKRNWLASKCYNCKKVIEKDEAILIDEETDLLFCSEDCRIIYFPPQSAEGYEGRWPFNLTRTQPFVPSDPSIPSEQNPFDFEAMIATITAEPSRTPTPTFDPQAVEATATP
jgi:hypothetical protein